MEVHVIGTGCDTRRRDSDLDRLGPSDRHNTLRHVSLLDCIVYEMNSRGSQPPYIVWGVGLQVGLGLDLFGYMVSIYKEYDIYHIRKNLPSSSRCLLTALRCTPTRTGHCRPCSYGLYLP